MRTLPPDIAERFRIETVDLDPEHVEVGNGAQDFEIAFGLGVEIQVEQDVDVRSGAVADRFKMHPQIAQDLAVDIDLGLERRAKSRPPALRLAGIVGEDVGLQRGKFLLANLTPDRFHAIEVVDRRLVPAGMIDAPGGAMRPVDPDTIADLAAEQFVAGHAEQFCLGVEQSVFDRAQRLRHHAAGSGTRRGKKLRMDALVLKCILSDHARRQTLNHRADAGRAKTFVEFAPADNAVFGGDLDEMVVSPAGIASDDFETFYLRHFCHGVPVFFYGNRRIAWAHCDLALSIVHRGGRPTCRASHETRAGLLRAVPPVNPSAFPAPATSDKAPARPVRARRNRKPEPGRRSCTRACGAAANPATATPGGTADSRSGAPA